MGCPRDWSHGLSISSMDSITSLVVLLAAVSFLSAWCATGRRFSYVGLQIALAFYLVAFQGFGPPTELAPARDRFAGILVGLIVMWIVFDEIWPVRTLTVMRRKLDSVVRNTAMVLTLGTTRETAGGGSSPRRCTAQSGWKDRRRVADTE